MKRITAEIIPSQIFITPCIGFVKISRVFDIPKHISFAFAWLNFSISIVVWKEKSVRR